MPQARRTPISVELSYSPPMMLTVATLLGALMR